MFFNSDLRWFIIEDLAHGTFARRILEIEEPALVAQERALV